MRAVVETAFFLLLFSFDASAEHEKATYDIFSTRMATRRGSSYVTTDTPVVALINANYIAPNASMRTFRQVSLRCHEMDIPMETYHGAAATGLPNLPLTSLISPSSRGVGMLTLPHLPTEQTMHGDREETYKLAKGLSGAQHPTHFSGILVLGENSVFQDHREVMSRYKKSLDACTVRVDGRSGGAMVLEDADSASDRDAICKRWQGALIPQIRTTVKLVQKAMGSKTSGGSFKTVDIGSSGMVRRVRVHDIADSMRVDNTDMVEMFSAHMCKAGVTKDIGESVGQHMQMKMRTFLPSYMSGMFDGIAKVFTGGLLGPIVNALVKGITDAFVDLFTLGLVVAFAAIVESDVTCLGDSIEVEVLFYCPPALTIMLSGAIVQKLCFTMTGYLIKMFARFFSDEITPTMGRKIAHDIADDVTNTLETTLLHELEVPLTHTLSYGLKDAVPHYYYCTHCYYYGDYCQYCFYHRDYNWLNRAWWQGRLHQAHYRTQEIPSDPEKDSENEGGPQWATPPQIEKQGDDKGEKKLSKKMEPPPVFPTAGSLNPLGAY